MKSWQVLLMIVGFGVPLASAFHDTGCVIQSAPFGSYSTINIPVDLNGDTRTERYYCTAREPQQAFVGAWSYCYEESWGYAGLQRTGIGLLGDWFPPGCDQQWGPLLIVDSSGVHVYPQNAPQGMPCLVIDEDPISHDVCGHWEFYDRIIM